jgi:XTP/dITP diphosphohydrolase
MYSLSMILYAATSNHGKLGEFTSAAATAGIDVLALPGLASMLEPVEDAVTFMGNAELKAIAYSRLAPNLLVFADDSGLEAHTLHGAPGARSARYADDLDFERGQGSKDERNNRALLSAMQFHTDRSARFVCALALARDGQVLLRAEGTVDGQILPVPRGSEGFGYDPLFLIPALGITLAELPRDRKWEISHRGKAFRSLLAQISEADL